MSEVITGRPVWIGGFELSNQLNAVALDLGADDMDGTTLANDTRVHKRGLKTAGFSIEGFFDSELDAQQFSNMDSAEVPVAVAAQEGNVGELAYFFKTMQSTYQHGGSVGELHSITAGGNARGDVARGTIHVNATGQTADGASAGIQQGAVASGAKLVAGLFVTSLSGIAPTLDVTIESDDNSGFTTAVERINFATASAIGGQILELSGPVTDDYWRVDFTLGGTAPSFNFFVVVGIQ